MPAPQKTRPARLNGPQVTTARSDVDLVVTENGVADLRGLDTDARRAALLTIAAPQHREALERTAAERPE